MRQSKFLLPAAEGCETCEQALTAALAQSDKADAPETPLTPRFRPVADLAGGGIFGHLASIHGPPDRLLCSPSRLFDVARRLGKTADLYRHYFLSAVDRFVGNHAQGFLLLPLFDGEVELGAACADILADATGKLAFPVERVIVVHPGVGMLDGGALDRTLAAAHGFRRFGFKLAAGALACPRSEKLLWSVLGPEFVIIEEGVLEGSDPNLLRIGGHAELVAATAG